MNKKFSFNTNFCKALILIFLSDICNRKDKNYPLLNAVLPFDETKGKFEIHFYLVGILFIIFDLEIALLFPWAVSANSLGYFGFFSVISFLTILTVGFIYEWKKGALEWNLG